ncbi:MAG: branched-chain-amino-acid transaminase [Chromatiales bacterium]|jgi:branched-chain amino acid aminotransferase|nr:branched-chain-amino-acid transaminase [Chromatiales bacterium]
MTIMFEKPEFAMLNGAVVPFDEAKISVMAPGLTFAVTVFEGLRGYWNDEQNELFLFRVHEHLERMQFSMRLIELGDPPSNETLHAQMLELIHASKMREDVYVRAQAYIDDWGDMSATGPTGSSIICRKRPRTDAFRTGKHFSVSSWRRNADDASPPRMKATANYLNSRLAGLEAKRSGFDGAIILNRDGTVSEGPGGCVFMVRGDTLVTPPVTAGILESITRGTLITLAADLGIEVAERDVGRTELYLADEIFYCGTGQELVPILSIDRKAVRHPEPGPVTRALQGRYDAVVRGNVAEHQDWLTPVYAG